MSEQANGGDRDRDDDTDGDATEVDTKLQAAMLQLAKNSPETLRALSDGIRRAAWNSSRVKVDRRTTETVCGFLVALADKVEQDGAPKGRRR